MRDRRVAVVFASIIAATLIFDAAHAAFWQRRHDMAPAAAVLILLLVAALLRRHRWAWWVSLTVSATGLPPWVIYRIVVRDPSVASVLGLIVSLVELALLFSTPMRRYVRVGRWSELSATRAA